MPLYAEGYGHPAAVAQALTSRAALQEAAHYGAAEWLDRDRNWKEELTSALKLTKAQEQDVDMASLPEALRKAAHLPAVRAAIRSGLMRRRTRCPTLHAVGEWRVVWRPLPR